MRRNLCGILFGLLVSSTLFAVQTQTITIGPTQSQFTVTLPANPTTGFQWRIISYDKTKIALVKSVYETPTRQQIGAGGKMIFTFKTIPGDVYPQSSTIHFMYARSWDPNQGTARDVVVNVNTAPQKPSAKTQ